MIYQAYGKETGYIAIFTLLAAIYAFVALSVLVLGEETKGKTLEELTVR
jgi:hypothetical protein